MVALIHHLLAANLGSTGPQPRCDVRDAASGAPLANSPVCICTRSSSRQLALQRTGILNAWTSTNPEICGP